MSILRSGGVISAISVGYYLMMVTSATSMEADRTGSEVRAQSALETKNCMRFNGAGQQGVGQNPTKITTVKRSADLVEAISKSKSGECIMLETGVYTEISINNVHFDRPIVIRSLNPGAPATIVGLKISDSTGIDFVDLDFTAVGDRDAYYPFRLSDVQRLTISSSKIHGDPAVPPELQKRGMLISNSEGVVIQNSEFYSQWSALTVNNSDDIMISKNHFHDLDKGGIESGGCSDIKITNNYFNDFIVGRSTHSDAIQLYTAGAKTASHDVVIKDNVYERGSGTAAQGIFVQDETGHMPYHNISITGNAVIGSMWNAIYVKNVEGSVVIKDNIAATWPGIDEAGVGTAEALKTTAAVTSFQAMIFLRGDNKNAVVTEEGNRAQIYLWGNGTKIPAPRGNIELGKIADSGSSLLRNWASTHAENPYALESRAAGFHQ